MTSYLDPETAPEEFLFITDKNIHSGSTKQILDG